MVIHHRGERGFSLIELLTVMAIIAIIAGFIFPLASGMRDKGNQSTCIGNLQSIGQALKLYRLDEREYPPALYGWLDANAPENQGKSVADMVPTTFLYPHYARSRREFKCPSNSYRFDEARVTDVILPNPLKRVPNPGGGYTLRDLWWTSTGGSPHKIAYYTFDSYDGGILPPNPMSNGTIGMTTTPHYELHYRRDWAEAPITGNGSAIYFDRQLLNRNPEDSTFVTACTYHRSYRGGALVQGPNSWDMVLYVDGHTEKRPSSEVALSGPFIVPKPS